MQTKAWKKSPPSPAGFAQSVGLTPFQAQLLYARGVREPSEVEGFLTADSRLSHDPMLLPYMGEAVARLKLALGAGETIGVFGDFDTDGITGTALMVTALQELGAEAVSYLPHRVDEGHGLNTQAVEQMRDKGVSLMITVDCGVSSPDEVAFADSIGIDTIITDHHTVHDGLPPALAVVNPALPDSKYPYPALTGVGLAFKLVEALWTSLGRPRPDHLLELVALGTVADVGPLTGENRFLVRQGLERLNRTEHPGLKALIARSRLRPGALDTESLSFGLIPRLNAAGRLSHASASLELLISSDLEEAKQIAEGLEAQNEERRRLSREGMDQAVEQVEAARNGPPSAIVVEHPDWTPGILGLIAGNLVERYYRPAVAVRTGEELSRASARSIPEFDIVGALRRSKDVFDRFGGHPRAAGFTVPTQDLPRVRQDLESFADGLLAHMDLKPSITYDCEISPVVLNDANFAFIKSLSPFGEANPAPVFLTRNAGVAEVRRLGSRQEHLKMLLSHDGRTWDAIAFRQGDRRVEPGDSVDLVYTAGIRQWGSIETVELTVLDLKTER